MWTFSRSSHRVLVVATSLHFTRLASAESVENLCVSGGSASHPAVILVVMALATSFDVPVGPLLQRVTLAVLRVERGQ